MRILLMALVITTAAVLLTPSALADEPQAAQQGASATQAAKDPNYRWYNNQWWYWMPQEKSWQVWTGDKWLPYEQARSQGAVRSYSYEADNQDSPQYSSQFTRLFGTPLNTVPNNVRNTQIIGSYGMRSAGSKMIGNY